MKIASVADVKANLSAYIKASTDELVVITKNGKPVAVLLPIEDDNELERLALAYSRRFQAILHEAREQFQITDGILHDDFWREMEDERTEKTPAHDNAA
jgi:prevent-host-death family protein